MTENILFTVTPQSRGVVIVTASIDVDGASLTAALRVASETSFEDVFDDGSISLVAAAEVTLSSVTHDAEAGIYTVAASVSGQLFTQTFTDAEMAAINAGEVAGFMAVPVSYTAGLGSAGDPILLWGAGQQPEAAIAWTIAGEPLSSDDDMDATVVPNFDKKEILLTVSCSHPMVGAPADGTASLSIIVQEAEAVSPLLFEGDSLSAASKLAIPASALPVSNFVLHAAFRLHARDADAATIANWNLINFASRNALYQGSTGGVGGCSLLFGDGTSSNLVNVTPSGGFDAEEYNLNLLFTFDGAAGLYRGYGSANGVLDAFPIGSSASSVSAGSYAGKNVALAGSGIFGHLRGARPYKYRLWAPTAVPDFALEANLRRLIRSDGLPTPAWLAAELGMGATVWETADNATDFAGGVNIGSAVDALGAHLNFSVTRAFAEAA